MLDSDLSLEFLRVVEEAAMKRTLASRAADTYVLASKEKIGAAAPYKVMPLDDVAGVITDAPQDDPTVVGLKRTGVMIVPAGS